MGGLPDLFTCIDSQRPAQPLHWKYPREAQIFADSPISFMWGDDTSQLYPGTLPAAFSCPRESPAWLGYTSRPVAWLGQCREGSNPIIACDARGGPALLGVAWHGNR